MTGPNSMESSRFFEYGEVSLEERDFSAREAAVRICVPCCLFQAVTPALLGAGVVDQLRVREPLAVWVPLMSQQRLSPSADRLADNALARVNMELRDQAAAALRSFQALSALVANPSDLVPMLPLGTYVTLRFRCRVDDVLKVLSAVQGVPVDGVAELQWALASVLACALQGFQAAEALRRRLPGS